MKRLGCTIWQPSKKLTISHKSLYFPTLVNSCFLSYCIFFILCTLPSESLAKMILSVSTLTQDDHMFLFLLTLQVWVKYN